MAKAVAKFSAEQLRATLRYEPATGRLFWLPRERELFATENAFANWNAQFPGDEAFKALNQHGYRRGAVFGQRHLAHRVIWFLQTGEWPASEIDHVNGDRSDNRWCNLRLVTRTENMRNQRRYRSNTSGVTGVSWSRRHKKWRAVIRIAGKDKTLGYFEAIEDASAARAVANAKYGFSERHGSDLSASL